ncbi:HAD family hydrolase, partial [Pontiella sp.]|uniref:HAD family hydrolase n=1 Tax=Pontiella sp. TaxID=2837462 RepID=UPI00356939BA
MLAAVIFDFDGIIVDSEPMHFRAFNEALKPMDIEMTWEEYCATYIGFDDRDAFRAILKAHNQKHSSRDLKHLIEQKAKVFQTFVQNGEATPLPGAVELIKSIPVRLPVALCSGALREDIDPILEKLGIESAFSV